MDPPVKITFQLEDFPTTPTGTGDGLCQECYDSFKPVGPARRKVPRISSLRVSSKSCQGCQTLLDFFTAAQRQSVYPVSASNPVDLKRSWAYWVSEYSQKKHTNESQAIALSGLITFVQDLKKDEPLLGLWKQELAEGLLWERGIWHEPAPRKRIAPFPSWTWMSLPGAVQYPSFRLTSKHIELIHPRICWSQGEYDSSLEIAELLLRAKVLKGTLTYHGRESAQSSLYVEIGSSKVPLFERVDIPDSYYDNTTVQLILIGGTDRHWFFLIASNVVNPERNPYVRIGRAYSPCDRAFKKLEEHFKTVNSQVLNLR
ncbi:hypothetical protein DPSP01_009820 [Paraphaeosphaeria sporulosa]|uniref:Heterokaryon incompatibility domain-containing protein n=1 Tax=Paraphaeosphaeria sporulosa TaxID=1460663 RepID=A0A177C8R2_9PLEO|nr:uncharacterized protein CC84DRAFT_1220006 [Paraphaeosphaeria sporulosa]OAG03100.1 hypothetical protein CC84DRAFT_1220006 [Paraphaeosphaeria sporulosa]